MKNGKLILKVLIVILLTNMLPINVLIASAEENNSSVVSNTGEIIEEVEEKREENTKHFLKDDNTYEAVMYDEPVHYLKDGKWKDIDNSFQDMGDFYQNIENDFTIKVSKRVDSDELISIEKQKYKLNWNIGISNKEIVSSDEKGELNANDSDTKKDDIKNNDGDTKKDDIKNNDSDTKKDDIKSNNSDEKNNFSKGTNEQSINDKLNDGLGDDDNKKITIDSNKLEGNNDKGKDDTKSDNENKSVNGSNGKVEADIKQNDSSEDSERKEMEQSTKEDIQEGEESVPYK